MKWFPISIDDLLTGAHKNYATFQWQLQNGAHMFNYNYYNNNNSNSNNNNNR